MNSVNFAKALAATCAIAMIGVVAPAAALADDDAKIEARVAAWGSACKNRVAVVFPKSTMADISVELGATLKQSIDAGTTTLQDIKKGGLSYNWTFKKHFGSCDTDGKGNVTNFTKAQ
ncbi:MAG: hypothetical protein ACKN83_10400 [Vulcanococcus sp.]